MSGQPAHYASMAMLSGVAALVVAVISLGWTALKLDAPLSPWLQIALFFFFCAVLFRAHSRI